MKSEKSPDRLAEQPPRHLTRFIKWLVAPHLREEILGDLQERYSRRVKTLGAPGARRRYWLESLAYMRPAFIKRQKSEYSTPFYSHDMIRNYFKIAFRNLAKNKSYSSINIGGLAVGMAVAMLTGLWLLDELTFNTYHKNYETIAQVKSRTIGEHGVGINTSLQYPLGNELKANYEEYFKNIVMTSWNVDVVLAATDQKVSRKGLYMEPGAPEMLSLKMLYGSWAGLRDEHSIMLSSTTAQALFGSANPLHKLVKINNQTYVKVTGVYEDLPLNTQFNELKFISPFKLWVSENKWISENATTDWDNHFLKVYVQLKPGLDFKNVSTKIKDAELKNLGNFKEQARLKPQVFLHPMSDWHLRNIQRTGVPDAEPILMLWIVGTIGAIVLFLACINFMNLSTARSEKRSKEIGVRKAIGSLRIQLIGQFLSESLMVAVLAFFVSVLLVYLALPWFNDIVGKQLTILHQNPYYWLLIFGFILFTGLLAGSYPALYLSSFQPVKVLKGIGSSLSFKIGNLTSIPRKVFVVTQFSVSITLITGAIIVYRQIQYAQNRPVGYDRDGLLMVEMKSGDFYGKYDLLRTELKSTGVVAEMSESMGRVTEVTSGNGGFNWRGKNPNLDDSFGTLVVTSEYGKTIGWQFVQGRDFSRDFSSDSSGMVVNEAAVKYMGLENPVGENISWKFQDSEMKNYKILGVIKDMVMESPYDPINPTVFMIKAHGGVNWINIKLNSHAVAKDALPKIEAVFKKIVPSAPFEYKFVDEEYARKFASEDRVGKLVTFFAILAIFISCLGLLGLASFIAEQRTKEIGIRKVLGASITNLWQLLSKDFVLLVVISFLIASPAAYYFMKGWLEKYNYRTEISWWIFALSGIGVLFITLLTVSFQAIRAALLDPVNSLRNE
jgi:putative ABC transport system permease protein